MDDLEFISIESEKYREYVFIKDGEQQIVRINSPVKLNVSKSGGHRILDSDGISHYIPSGWIHLSWFGSPPFVA